MTSKAPNATATEPNFASAEYAEQWRRGKRLRAEVFEALSGNDARTGQIICWTMHGKKLASGQRSERVADEATHRKIVGLGIECGWHCLEAGAGVGRLR